LVLTSPQRSLVPATKNGKAVATVWQTTRKGGDMYDAIDVEIVRPKPGRKPGTTNHVTVNVLNQIQNNLIVHNQGQTRTDSSPMTSPFVEEIVEEPMVGTRSFFN
jgi:hypothetical protein